MVILFSWTLYRLRRPQRAQRVDEWTAPQRKNQCTYIYAHRYIYLNTYAYIHTYISWALGQSTFKMRRENERSTPPHPWGASVESRLWRPVSTNICAHKGGGSQQPLRQATSNQNECTNERFNDWTSDQPSAEPAVGKRRAGEQAGGMHAFSTTSKWTI